MTSVEFKTGLFLRRIQHLCRLIVRSAGIHFHRARYGRLGSLKAQYRCGEETPWSLTRGCVGDLRMALYRMGRRVDALPNWIPFLFGGSKVDANGYLVPDTRTLGCMTDMQRSESDFPNATEFDWELYRTGWEAGARWAESSLCRLEQKGNTYESPEGTQHTESASSGGGK